MSNLERTPIVDKNGKQTHVHKRVDPAKTTRDLPAVPTLRYDPMKDFEESRQVIEDIMGNGVLEETEDSFQSPYVYLGKTKEGLSLSLRVRVKAASDVTTTELEHLDEAWVVEMDGQALDAKGNFAIGMLGHLLEDLEGSDLGDSSRANLGQLWIRYFNHDSMPGTEKQMAKENELRNAGIDTSEDNWGNWAHLIENDRGHEYGDPLFRPVSVEDLADILVLTEVAKVEGDKREYNMVRRFRNEARQNVYAEGLDPDEVVVPSDGLTRADLEEIRLARAEYEKVEHLSEDYEEDVERVGGKENLRRLKTEGFARLNTLENKEERNAFFERTREPL